MKTNMYKVLQSAIVEKDVENAYRTALLKAFGYIGATFSSKYGTDGLMNGFDYNGEKTNLIMLLECKYDMDFSKQINIMKVLVQALYYLQRFEHYGDDLPNVIMVGDKNECFCLHSNDIKDYLDSDGVDWTIAPSSAATKNPKLVKAMMADDKITPYIYKVDKHFNFSKFVEKAIELSEEQVNFIRITEKNIDRVFNDFVSNVLYYKKITKDMANKLVNVFLSVLVNPGENYLHPKKPQTLVTKDLGNIRIDRAKFIAFFRHFEKDYTPKEKDRLTAICDRLIEDTTRRFQGEFFTPTPWVEEAHRMIEKEFGEDWKEKYVVWDPAWGTGNLTRDYKFKELYVSTLNASDLGLAEQRGYNPEATKFQFDFLNDPYEKLPEGLREAIESGRKIIILMNPPYGRASSGFKGEKKGTTGTARTKIAIRMGRMGQATSQLYTQFLYAVKELENRGANLSVGVYSPPLFMTGPSFAKFRENFYSSFKFCSGMLFKAAHFDSVSTSWGVSFTLWTAGVQEPPELSLSLKDVDKFFKIVKIGQKLFYNTDEVLSAAQWVREKTKGLKVTDCPQLSNPINIKPSGKGRLTEDNLGYFYNDSNAPKTNGTNVSLLSSGFSHGQGLSVTSDNFDRIISLFAARKTITSNWINQKDEYIAPNTEHPDYEQWNNDCLVYSLFNNSSNQSSLRNIEYKGETWDIKNQWFWMSRQQMSELAEEHNFDALYQDVRVAGEERFVFNKLQDLELSDDAWLVLQAAEELVEDSFEYREMLHQEHPEYHLNTWDAGWYQIKLILKEFMPDRLKEFRALYKGFEDRMREGVYKFGFLK